MLLSEVLLYYVVIVSFLLDWNAEWSGFQVDTFEVRVQLRSVADVDPGWSRGSQRSSVPIVKVCESPKFIYVP